MGLKKSFLPLLSIFSFLLIGTRCSKDDPPKAELPPITQAGLNTIGFTINETVWIPYNRCDFGVGPCGEITAEYGYPDHFNFHFVRHIGGKRSSFLITNGGFSTITSTGDKTDSVSAYYNDDGGNSISGSSIGGSYSGPLAGSRFIITKLDLQNQIIAGEFEFVLQEQASLRRIITLRDGRFDFTINACKCSN